MTDHLLDSALGRNLWDDIEELDLLEKDGLYITEWLSCYRQDDVDRCLDRVKTINYGEGLTLKGGLEITAKSSGYHLGAAMYSLQYGTENLLVIDSFSKHKYRHPLPLDTEFMKGHSKVLLTDCCNEAEGFEPANKTELRLSKDEVTINRFVSVLRKMLKEHPAENILMPIRNPIFLLDLIDILQLKVGSFRKLHIISSVFPAVESYANANVDYLNPPLQKKIFSKNPQLPISTSDLKDKRRLEIFPDLFSFVEVIRGRRNYMMEEAPSIYITVDSTLRLGYSAKILEILNSDLLAGTILFTDPFLSTPEVFHPLYDTNRLRL